MSEELEPIEEEAEFITLDYDDGGSERCEVLGVFSLDDEDYIALAPESDDDAVYLYGYEEHDEDGTFSLTDLDDDEFEAAAAEYERLMDEDE